MKNRKNKRLTMYIAGGLAAVSLCSVGFASWVITGTSNAESDITVSVGTVQNDTLTASILPENKDTNLCFNNVENQPAGALVSNSSTDTNYEDLTFVLPVQITGNISKLSKINFTFTGTLVSTAGLYGSTEATNYLIAPWVTIDGASKVEFTKGTGTLNPDKTSRVAVEISSGNNDNTYTATFTFNFQWGNAFANINPGQVTTEMDKVTLTKRLEDFSKAFPTKPGLHVLVEPISA